MRLLVLCSPAYQLFPTASVDALVAALDSASWDVSEAVLLQTSRGDTHTPAAGKSRKWKKLGVSDVFTSVVVRPTPVWNGANASVTAGRDSVGETRAKRSPSPTRQPSPNVAPTAPSRVQQRHQQSTASAAPESAPTNSRYLFRQAADGEASAIHMSRMHAENRRKYAQLATRAHHMNDARAARMFREISQREERLQQLWANRITRQVTKIDLHGLFVSEALSIVAQVVGSMVQGDSVQFITGRGMHSSGNIPRIKLAVEGEDEGWCVCVFLFHCPAPRIRLVQAPSAHDSEYWLHHCHSTVTGHGGHAAASPVRCVANQNGQ